jgi:hypothetical protein
MNKTEIWSFFIVLLCLLLFKWAKQLLKFLHGTEDPHNQYSEDNKDNNLSHLKQQQKFAKYELIKSITITNLQHLMTSASIPKSHFATFYTKFLSISL